MENQMETKWKMMRICGFTEVYKAWYSWCCKKSCMTLVHGSAIIFNVYTVLRVMQVLCIQKSKLEKYWRNGSYHITEHSGFLRSGNSVSRSESRLRMRIASVSYSFIRIWLHLLSPPDPPSRSCVRLRTCKSLPYWFFAGKLGNIILITPM